MVTNSINISKTYNHHSSSMISLNTKKTWHMTMAISSLGR